MSSPCHIELVLSEKDSAVPAAVVRTLLAELIVCSLLENRALGCSLVGMQPSTQRADQAGPVRLQEESKERKMSKREAAKKLRSGTKSPAAV